MFLVMFGNVVVFVRKLVARVTKARGRNQGCSVGNQAYQKFRIHIDITVNSIVLFIAFVQNRHCQSYLRNTKEHKV